MNRDPLRFHPSERQRRASCVERPAPRSLLTSRPAYALAIAAWFLVWLIVRAVRAFWSWA